ncbi:hypothetical protein ABT288_02825 [Streptomyces sp. NPDC001093]
MIDIASPAVGKNPLDPERGQQMAMEEALPLASLPARLTRPRYLALEKRV